MSISPEIFYESEGVKVYHGDCLKVLTEADWICDGVITSPPYNLGANPNHRKKSATDQKFYSDYQDTKTPAEYIEWLVELFKCLQDRVHPQGVVCLNLSYSSRDASLPYRVLVEIERQTTWKVRDTLCWKKPTAIPFQTSPRNVSRISELVFVLAQTDDFITNKSVKSVNARTGQKFYEYMDNYIEAPAYDRGTRKHHKATFSCDFVKALLERYFPAGSCVLDPFAGVGTTGLACQQTRRQSILIDIDALYVNLARQRLQAS
jgi:site-specific DNA-methyltransferase (adenine-specific)